MFDGQWKEIVNVTTMSDKSAGSSTGRRMRLGKEHLRVWHLRIPKHHRKTEAYCVQGNVFERVVLGAERKPIALARITTTGLP